MRCPKCGGLMSMEEFISVAEGGMPWSYEGWRCVQCGEVIDSMILLNRMKSKTAHEERAPVHGGGRRR